MVMNAEPQELRSACASAVGVGSQVRSVAASGDSGRSAALHHASVSALRVAQNTALCTSGSVGHTVSMRSGGLLRLCG